MKLNETQKVDTNLYELNITVDGEQYAKALDASFKKNAAKLNIPGFRKGKAPKSIVYKMVGESYFYEDAINSSYGEAYEEALKESGLEAVAYPEVELKDVDGTHYTFVAKVTVKPEVTLGEYKGLKAERESDKVTDADVETELNAMADRNARMGEAPEGAKAEMGDTAVIDYEGFVGDVAFEGGKGEDHPLSLGSGQFIPGFEEGVVGHKVGESFDVNVTFPTEYHSEELAGKDATFKVTIKELKRKELPTLDDEFAKDVSEYDTLDELKDSIRKGIQTNHEKQAEQSVENDLIDQVVGGMKADIPDAMIESRIEELVQDFQYRISQQGLKLEQYLQYMGMTMDQFKEQFREQADKQVKMRLAMEAIVAKESIEATEEEFEAEIKRIADAYQMEADKVKSLVDAAAVKKDLAVNKAIDFVKEKANIVLGAAEEKKPAKKTTRKTTKKAAAKKDEEPKEEEKGE